METANTSPSSLLKHIEVHASVYFPEFTNSDVYVELLSEKPHVNSIFYRFGINAGAVNKSVLAKVPIHSTGAKNEAIFDRYRPRISPLPDTDLIIVLQYEALAAIHKYFSSLNDPRFGSIRVLDFIPDQQAIIMEEFQGVTLRQLFIESSRLHLLSARNDINSLFQNAGAWLHAYHESANQNSKGVLQSRCEDFIRTISKFVNFLSERVGGKPYLNQVAEIAARQAIQTLPVALPLGLRHGDFALRNLIIGADNRLAGIDTLANWHSAIYEDIAYFFISLKTIKLQVLTQGLAFSAKKLKECENKFLIGYFNRKQIPQKEILLFEVLLWLERWCSEVVYLDKKLTERSNVIRTLAFKLMNRFFKRIMNGYLNDLEKFQTVN